MRQGRISATGRGQSWSARLLPQNRPSIQHEGHKGHEGQRSPQIFLRAFPPALRSIAGSGALRILRARTHPAQGFVMSLPWLATSHLLVPGRVKGPRPRFTDRTACHGLEGARLSDRAQIDVNENSTEHDERENVMQDVADSHSDAAEGACPNPEDDSCDQERNAADHDLPELGFLAGIEEPRIGWLELLRSRHSVLEVAHPAGVRRGPLHWGQPVQRLQREKKHECQAEPWVHHAAEGAASEDRRKPSKQPRQVNTKSREQCEKEEERHHPMQEACVDLMPQQFTGKHFGSTDGFKSFPGLIVKALNRGSHGCPPHRDLVAAAADLSSRSAGKLPVIQIMRRYPGPAWGAISKRCSSTGWS